MPELPEVETIKNEIAPYLVGRTIQAVELIWSGIIKEPSVDEFQRRIAGRKVLGLRRRGKYLLLPLSSGETLVLHMKMSGSLLVSNGCAELPSYTRAAILLDDGRKILFRDPRKFGVIRLVRDPETVVGKLGPEPLEPGFTEELFAELLRRRSAPIKAVLCDQDFIAGVGNMYADEALFAAGIHPLRGANTLSNEEVRRLFNGVRHVLECGIGNKGASIRNYYRPDGATGTAHLEFKVAHQRGEPCPVCGTPLSYIKVRGRGTYFCPKCQPAAPPAKTETRKRHLN